MAKEGKNLHNYGLKLRLVPTAEQIHYFNKCIGCARFTYNFYLNEKQEVYKNTGETLSYDIFKKAFIKLKGHPAFSWLAEPDKFVLEKAMEDLDRAYDNFFAGRARFPQKKKKHASKQSIADNDIFAVDLGLTHFYIDSNGKKIENPQYYKQAMKRLVHLQRQLKNKKKGSANYKKQQVKIAKWHVHIANMRKDFLHQQSRKMVNENQVVILEDLNVKGMIRNKKLSRSIQDVGWGMFKQLVTYKAAWDYKHLVLVNTFFPSSKKCHGRKEKHTLLSLSDRVWVCPNCGCEHDRDVNAAKNIKEEGFRLLKERLAV